MANFADTVFKNMRGVISLFIVIGSFSFLFVLAYKKIPPENKDLLTVAVGLVLAALGSVANYYYGASKDKSDAEKAARLADPNVNAEISPPKKNKS